MTATTTAKPERPKGLKLLAAALKNRKSATMLGFGFASGLPFALLVGTLNAWLGEVGVKLATIGVLSWIGLAYSFKFLWSPLVDRLPLPVLERLGRRKSWIVLCQIVLVLTFGALAITNPVSAIGAFAVLAFVGAIASATQDIAIDGWRIDQADEDAPIELLSALNQFGYRTASIVGGAVALVMASTMQWPWVYAAMGGLMLVLVLGVTLRAPDSARPEPGRLHGMLAEPGALKPEYRAVALSIVGISWIWAIGTILHFMAGMLSAAPAAAGAPTHSVGDFTKLYGPWIIFATVLVPLGVAALSNWMARRQTYVLQSADHTHHPVRTAMNHLYSALVAPLAELSGRLGWGVLSVIGFILTYAICYNIWASFAYPFYLQEMHYSKEEVAFASKLFGIFMTMAGISLGGYLFVRLGRFPTILMGAILPPLGNFLYADLAEGGHGIDAFAHLLRLNVLAGWLGSDDRMVRLLLAISYENVVTGLALTAFVAYVSSIVSKQYGAIQYALLGSLVSLIGTLGRGWTGEAFDQYGYALVFRWTAATAILSTIFVLLEWARNAHNDRAANPETRG
jgi:MFS transporter, PAT family, beta-lactamase induction signal transducer AmpG